MTEFEACQRAGQVHSGPMRIRSWELVTATAAALALIGFCILFLGKPSIIPPTVQFQADFSKQQAAVFYAKARQQLRQAYWRSVWRSLEHLQFKGAWNLMAKGQGNIEGILASASSDVMAFVRFNAGQELWIRVGFAEEHRLAKHLPNP